MIEPIIPQPWIREIDNNKFDVTTSPNDFIYRTDNFDDAVRVTRLIENFRDAMYKMQLFIKNIEINNNNINKQKEVLYVG